MAAVIPSAVMIACGGSTTWDFSDAGAGAPSSGTSDPGCGVPCTSDQQCQTQCVNPNRVLYCCDSTQTVNGMGLCYNPPAPATTCPAAPVMDAGRPRDAGRVVDAGRRG
jgi:hypothetical protein